MKTYDYGSKSRWKLTIMVQNHDENLQLWFKTTMKTNDYGSKSRWKLTIMVQQLLLNVDFPLNPLMLTKSHFN